MSVPKTNPWHDHETETTQQTLGDWLEEWLALCQVRGLRSTSIEGYRRVLNLYIPGALRERKLDEVHPRQLNRLYADLLTRGRRHGTGGLSARTVRYVHAALRRALSDAVRHGLLAANPADAADPPSRRASQARVFPTWTPDELRRFLAAVEDDPWYAALHLAACTGLRRSEILGLRWNDLDLNPDRGELQVIQTVVQPTWKPEISEPKTRNSRRRVALDRRTVEVLLRHRERAEANVARRRKTVESTDLVFPGPSGGPANPGLLSIRFKHLVAKTGMRQIRFHDLRHTHATHSLRAGIHPKIVSERLGHASIAMTLDLYSHCMPSLQREAAEIVASLIADGDAAAADL